MRAAPDCRQSVIEVLKLLSSPERQLAYERNVPQIAVTNELLSGWFDDTYLPESGKFRECFSAAELEAMAAFDAFFEEHSNSLPTVPRGVSDWLMNENWRQIMQRAKDLLTVLAALNGPPETR
jgi:hypothetical protein